ncbi:MULTISPECIES: GNAT family N-acetyltransferase [unclassified Streptomyces]|uniref:GNAT family N-acetyltransferase n=1 Tax=unclassified Streptomyces TaxID=2593676 RepID=UPI00106E17E8|nr:MULTISPECIES: GNAT family N-acetyltransferase [unclassified Streptomyces]MBH5130386.1 GNAT family N-acetyltransferase [Streptomyces sp. HB-N217]
MSDVTDAVAHLAGHGTAVPAMVLASVGALMVTAGLRSRWSRRHGHAPPADDTGARPPTDERPAGPGQTEREGGGSALWQMRTTVRDEPGSLAELCAALAERRIDILSLQTHPLAEGTVDEFLLRAPGELSGTELAGVVTAAGGARTWTERADAHDLVDAPTRVLGLATRTALDAAELPLALRQLLGRCTIRSLPATAGAGAAAAVPPEGALEDTVLRLRAPEGGVISVERPHLPFTPAEFARARALVELDARLGPRIPRGRDVLTLAEGSDITVRRADTRDVPAAKAMHERCSARTLGLRYHGPVGDADRYLGHLLSPRFGRTLAAQTASGRIVGLGHLLWDGDETEVALLVEDAWQRRGIGGELLGRLVAMAAETGCESVYAVTQASNTGMVAAMRGLGLPLDYQIEEGTLVVTARLDPSARAAAHLPQGDPVGRE